MEPWEPNQHERPGQAVSVSLLHRYRRLKRRRIPRALYRVLFALCVAGVVLGYGYWADEESETWQEKRDSTSWALLREADVILTLARETDSWPSWVQWLVVGWDSEGALRHVHEEMGRLSARGLLNGHAREAQEVVTALVEADLEGLDMERMRRQIENQGPWEWERKAVTAENGGSVPGWFSEHEESSRWYGREMLRRALLAEGLWWVVFLLGLPFVPDALRCFRPSQHQKWSMATKVWRPRWTLGAYFASLGISAIIFWDYWFVPPIIWEVAYMPAWIASDAVWRMASVGLLLPFLMVRMRDLPKLLGLDKAPNWRPVLGMFSIAFVYNWLLFFLMQDIGAEHLGQAAYWHKDGWLGLLFSITSGVILAPLVEEIVFRGMLLNAISRGRRFWWAMGVSTVLFVLIHFYGLYGSLSVAFFGVAACALYRATGSLWTAILYHAMVNGMITLAMWPVYHGLYST